MALKRGSCRFGLWYVNVWWDDEFVRRVMFSKNQIPGGVPEKIRRYCAGQSADPSELVSIALEEEGIFQKIYSVVKEISYGQTETYKSVAIRAGTHPRVVGNAMAKNPTPIVIPCHRVVSVAGIGGFTPSPEIKEALLAMEWRNVARISKKQDKTLDKSAG